MKIKILTSLIGLALAATSQAVVAEELGVANATRIDDASGMPEQTMVEITGDAAQALYETLSAEAVFTGPGSVKAKTSPGVICYFGASMNGALPKYKCTLFVKTDGSVSAIR